MKILVLLLKRILNNPFMFIMTVFQTAVISVGMIGVYNAYNITHACINSISGENRMIYRSRSSDFDEGSPTDYFEVTNEIMIDCDDYLGVSFAAESITYMGENASLEIARRTLSGQTVPDELNAKASYEDFATTFYYNAITLKSIEYPLAKGSQNDMFSEINGAVPCLLGGTSASKYKIGDIINAHTFASEDNSIISIDYVVVGILKNPLILFSGKSGQTDLYRAMKLSEVFDSGLNEPFVLVTNSDLAEKYGADMSGVRKNYFVFFDGETNDEQMERYAVMLGDGYASVDKDMIASEILEITRSADAVLPFVIILFVISLSAVISLSVIAFLEGMKEYSIYYIFGCTKGKMFLINILYSLCYLVLSGAFTIILVKIVQSLVYDDFKPYFYQSFEITASLAAAFAVTTIVSAAVPFLIRNKMNIKELIIKTPD